MNFIDELKWRGLVKDVTDEAGLLEQLKQPTTVYCGFDPTADSLHIGHLQQLILLKRYQLEGHLPIALIGGATGSVGDPSGKSSERVLQSLEEIEKNVQGIKKQVEHVLEVNHYPIKVLNNYDWLSQISMLELLRDYGKFFNLNTMLAKETVASRLETGISFTEFSYTILQAIDWLKLYEDHQCKVQIGGSDQWGNLVSGSELIRKMHGHQHQVFGITSPLITKSDGSKFGKSEGGNIWLDPQRQSAYSFYQFWINVADEDIEDFSKRLSLKPVDQLEQIFQEHRQAPHRRFAQKELAAELTKLVFDQDALDQALKITETYFSGALESLPAHEIKMALEGAPAVVIQPNELLIDTLVQSDFVKSKSEARTLLKQNSISVNGTKVTDFNYVFTESEAIDKSIFIVRRGKKNYLLVELNK